MEFLFCLACREHYQTDPAYLGKRNKKGLHTRKYKYESTVCFSADRAGYLSMKTSTNVIEFSLNFSSYKYDCFISFLTVFTSVVTENPKDVFS